MSLPALDFRDPVLAQRIADGSLVISASAGSGKTFALVTLVLGFLGRGGRAREVLATTFGREAAADLRMRLLHPLDQLAGWDTGIWAGGLEALRTGHEAWDGWLAAIDLPVRPEIGTAARLWRPDEAWMTSPRTARAHWIRIRREGELLRTTTVHALARALLGARGGGGEELLEADDPALVCLLREAGREVLSLPEGDADEPAARKFRAWCEGREEGRDRWQLLAAAYDAHLDALGTWRASLDTSEPRETFLRAGRALMEAYAPFAERPLSAAALTKKEKPSALFLKHGLPKLHPEVPQGAVGLLEALERLGSRFLKEDGEPPNYYSDAFREVLAPLQEDLPARLEEWMTLLLERVFQRFRDLKAERRYLSYGDLVRNAWHAVRDTPEEPPALLLVDEYQDINPVQEAFLEALRARRTILVGDPKQAIYGFRGGVPELLRAKLAAAGDRAFRLPLNHRSSAAVVQTANAFVGVVVPALEPSAADPDGLQGHRGAGEGERRVALAGVPSGKLRGSDLAATAPWVAALGRHEGWEAAGFGPAQAHPRRRALLLPARTGLPELRRALQAARLEPLVQSREGFWDSPGVRLLMALLETLARPEAAVPRMAVLRSPWVGATDRELLAYVREGTGSPRIQDGLAWLDALAGRATQTAVSEALVRPGLLEFLAATSVHGTLEPVRARRNLERFLGWVPGLPTVPSLAWARLDRMRAHRDPGDAPAEDAAADLVVQTIHGAKGLEYDDVIVPLLAGDVKGVRKGTVRSRAGLPGSLWIGWKLGHARGPALAEFRREEQKNSFREGLNLLYVGLTRAKDRMALLQQWPVDEEGGTRPPPGGAQRRSEGKAVQWHHLATDLAEALPDLPRLERPPVMVVPDPAPVLPLRPPAAGSGLRRPEIRDSQLPAEDARTGMGTRIHALLREVLVREAHAPEAALAYLADHPLLQIWPAAGVLVRAVLRELEARGWLRLPRRTEYELPGAGMAGGLGRADLVLWEPERRNPVCIHLVDFKLAAEFAPEILDLHSRQLGAYRRALEVRFPRVPVDAWLMGLEGGRWMRVP